MIRKFLSVSILCLLFFHYAKSQPKDPFGVKIDTAKCNAVPFLDLSDFPRGAYKAELETFIHFNIGHQGLLGSCVGHALSHCLTVQRACQERAAREHINSMKHSASFIFNQLKKGENCQTGVYLTDALNLLKEKGVCLESTFSNDLISCSRMPDANARKEAKEYRIRDKYRLFSPGFSPVDKVNQAKWSLDANHPVIVSMNVTSAFSDGGFQAKIWDYDADDCEELYNHAMVILNYNDERDQFLLLNSYGVKWGQKGMVWIGYDDFALLADYGFILIR